MKITVYKPQGKDMNIPMPLSALKSATFWKLLNLDKDFDIDANKQLLIDVTDVLDMRASRQREERRRIGRGFRAGDKCHAPAGKDRRSNEACQCFLKNSIHDDYSVVYIMANYTITFYIPNPARMRQNKRASFKRRPRYVLL